MRLSIKTLLCMKMALGNVIHLRLLKLAFALYLYFPLCRDSPPPINHDFLVNDDDDNDQIMEDDDESEDDITDDGMTTNVMTVPFFRIINACKIT